MHKSVTAVYLEKGVVVASVVPEPFPVDEHGRGGHLMVAWVARYELEVVGSGLWRGWAVVGSELWCEWAVWWEAGCGVNGLWWEVGCGVNKQWWEVGCGVNRKWCCGQWWGVGCGVDGQW